VGKVSAADTFPCKAFQVIQYYETHDPDVAASWSHDGSYFLVKDTAAFSSLAICLAISNIQTFSHSSDSLTQMAFIP
jgi:hypothetical protein